MDGSAGQAQAVAGLLFAAVGLLILGWRVAGEGHPAGALGRIAADLLVGTAWVLAVNLAAAPLGLHIGWNPATALIAGSLGLPGVAALVVLAASGRWLP